MSDYRELLIGCGTRMNKMFRTGGRESWVNVHRLDINPDHAPDTVHDLTELPLPFPDDSFNEIHAYEVLEHTGRQGDYKFFFAQFAEFWRILKPGGLFCATCPAADSRWAWGDPSHTRVLMPEQLTFLVQPEYTRQVGVTSMSDFRNLYQADFDVAFQDERDGSFKFVLSAVKPSRITTPPRRRG